MSLEHNKAIALRFAKNGWGTNANWTKVWDELLTPDVVYHFNSSAEPIIGLQIYFKDSPTCIRRLKM